MNSRYFILSLGLAFLMAGCGQQSNLDTNQQGLKLDKKQNIVRAEPRLMKVAQKTTVDVRTIRTIGKIELKERPVSETRLTTTSVGTKKTAIPREPVSIFYITIDLFNNTVGEQSGQLSVTSGRLDIVSTTGVAQGRTASDSEFRAINWRLSPSDQLSRIVVRLNLNHVNALVIPSVVLEHAGVTKQLSILELANVSTQVLVKDKVHVAMKMNRIRVDRCQHGLISGTVETYDDAMLFTGIWTDNDNQISRGIKMVARVSNYPTRMVGTMLSKVRANGFLLNAQLTRDIFFGRYADANTGQVGFFDGKLYGTGDTAGFRGYWQAECE